MTRRAEVDLLWQDATVTSGGEPATSREVLRLPDAPADGFFDGPACRRLAVVDLDPDSGRPLPPPATFERPRTGRVTGHYRAPDGPRSPAGLAINAFGTAWKTVTMFERPLGLGRRVRWAFPGEQLLIVPRAGRRENAFYDRRTRSLQFFSFSTPGGDEVHTALSRDIVAHETGHALLDAVAPWLADTVGPESIATHEAVADLVAVLAAIDLAPLRERVLEAVGNDLASPNSFARVAEEFGRTRSGALPGHVALRDLRNTLRPADVPPNKPHELSQVLSGLLYDTLAATYESVRAGLAPSGLSPATVANRALGAASQLVQRLLIQGLDLLPPGEVGFADVGRAVLAADRALQPDDARLGPHRVALAERFVARGVVSAAAALDQVVPEGLSIPADEVGPLLTSDWLAHRYVDVRRDLLGIPVGARVRVLARVDALKQFGALEPATGKRHEQRQLILKVAWDVVEAVADPLLPTASARRISTGATVALRWSDGVAVAWVTGRAASDPSQRAGRDALLPSLVRAASQPGGPDLTLAAGVLEVRGAQSLLHLNAAPGPDAGQRGATTEPGDASPPPGVDAGAFFDLLRSRRPVVTTATAPTNPRPGTRPVPR